MRPVNHSIPEALATILRRAPLSDDKVAFAWRTAVGPALHNATSIELRNGVLYVCAKDDAWRREVERSAAVVRARLDSLLGKGVVRTIQVEPQ